MSTPSSLSTIVLCIGTVLLGGTACSSGSDPTPADTPSSPGGERPQEPIGRPASPGIDVDPGDAEKDESGQPGTRIVLGDRPGYLRSLLPDGELKRALADCDTSDVRPERFSISHRGAPLRLPEHSREGYLAAVEQGAGIVECDVTFTADGEAVCRHSQCDLHTTTDILATELAAACSVPPDPDAARPFAGVRCCTSDITLAGFATLRAKRDGGDPDALTLDDYLAGTPGWHSDPARDYATPMTLGDAIALLEPLGVAMTPELKAFDPPADAAGDFDRRALSRRMFDAFRAAGVPADRLYPQSFELDDIRHWRESEPEYSRRAVWLDGRYASTSFDVDDPATWTPGFEALKEAGVAYLAPPIWMLLTLDGEERIVPSDYAAAASASGLPLLSWSLERGVDVARGGGFYYRSIAAAFDDEGDQLRALDVLAREVGVEGVFSDWPATTTYFAHCRGAR